jgi:hypothetical protein
MPSSTGALFEDDMPATITFELDAWMPLAKDDSVSYEHYMHHDNDDDGEL